MAGTPLRRRRHRHHGRRHPGGDRRRAARRGCAGLVAEMRAQGTTTVEVKSGYGLDRRRRGPRAAAGRARSRRRPPSSARTSSRRASDRDATTSPWSPARCSPPARRTPAGSTSSASPPRRTRSTATRPARCSRRAGRPGWGCGCTPTSCRPGPGVQLAVELGAASVDHCTHLTDADVDALAGGDDRRHAAARRRVLHPVALPGRPPPARRRASTVALATDCNPGSCFTSSMPFCIALAVREMRMTPAEALWAATAGGAAALRRADVGHLGARRPGRPRRRSTRRPTGTSPTAPASRSYGPWTIGLRDLRSPDVRRRHPPTGTDRRRRLLLHQRRPLRERRAAPAGDQGRAGAEQLARSAPRWRRCPSARWWPGCRPPR